MWHLVRMTDFSHALCRRPCFDIVTQHQLRRPVTQEFLVTPAEAQIIHRGSM